MSHSTAPASRPISPESKRQAAYALNLCMVSVSQIIDYDDVYILEQEYDSILNNLNLEEMPKDEALLDILKQLLNVITFFRIQEGDRQFIEKEYQQRMTDAVWSAIPNLSVVVAGGNPITMAASLAAQVGIGYMNYRREKAKISAEREKERWKLQRSAMEQFNGLRRELFDTAWRLADTYQFPDAYRITERQITRYNRILQDRDDLRRYERLLSIADKFEAYPPFLYFLGNAANMVFQNERYDPSVRSRYRSLACSHFGDFLDRMEHNLLREDHLLASCALEYFDLLTLPPDSNSAPADRAYLESLLVRASDASGSAYDVLQLCAASYLKLGNLEKAGALLRVLVNEDYNAPMNAQLLSSLYVARYLQNGDRSAREDYLTLRTRIAPELLFPLPSDPEAAEPRLLQANFIVLQKKLLARKYSGIVTALMQQYAIRFNKVIPAADPDRVYPDPYYDSESEARKQDILELSDDPRAWQRYTDRLAAAHIETGIISVLNDLYTAVCALPCMKERSRKQQFYDAVREQILALQPRFDVLLSKLYSGDDSALFDCGDCRCLLNLSFLSFTGKAFDALYDIIVGSIKALPSMYEISCVESGLQGFCTSQGLPYPAVQPVMTGAAACLEAEAPLPFDERLLGRRAYQMKQELDAAQRMAACIRARAAELAPEEKSPFRVYIRNDGDFVDYIEKNRALREFGQDGIIAVIDHTGFGDKDLVFTTGGLCAYFRTLAMKTLSDPVRYEDVRFVQKPVPTLKIGDFDFMEKKISIGALYDVINDLAAQTREFEKAVQGRLESGTHR